MIGGCPHYGMDAYCERLKRTCNPATKGCILEGKVRLLESGNRGESMNSKIETLDLRPLRYQFEAEQNGKFEWEYEQEGPVDWIVNIKRT
jgi:uncharacterized protein (DUF2249 family)